MDVMLGLVIRREVDRHYSDQRIRSLIIDIRNAEPDRPAFGKSGSLYDNLIGHSSYLLASQA
jgi:hypothetical protein